MTYGSFAYLYDQLMREVPYDSWLQLVKESTQKYDVTGQTILDIACGTGELSVRFAKAGMNVTGVDLSADMLTVAQMKSEQLGLTIPFYQQNMVELELEGPFDVIVLFCDSLNYLQTEEEVIETFNKVHQHLNDDGIFLFDVHSIYKMMEIFLDQTYTHDDEEICYIWNCFQGEYSYSIEHELTFFVQEQSGKYNRYDEFHSQRTFPIETYQQWLKDAGFEVLEILADFTKEQPLPESERIFFVAKRVS